MKTLFFKSLLFLSIASMVGTVQAQGVLTAEMMWDMGRISDVQVSPDGSKILYGMTWYNLNENMGNTDLYLLAVAGGAPVRVTDLKGHEFNGRWRPDGKKIGFLSGQSGTVQLWEMNPDGSDKTMVSNIMDGFNGFAYSPKMDYILYTKDVKTGQAATELHSDLPQANVFIINDLMYRHWNAWSDYSYSHIFVSPYSPGDGFKAGTDIMDGEHYDCPMNPFGGMEQIGWSPDGKKIAYTCKKLSGKEYTLSTNSEIYLYDLQAKTTKNISEGNLGYDQDPVFSPDGTRIVWRSMKTPGYESDKDRILIYDLKSGSTKDYSEGFDQSSANFVWSANGNTLYFISGIQATYQIFSLTISGGNIAQLTTSDHDYTSLALAGDQLIGSRMSMSMPTEIFKINSKGEETQLSFANKEVLDKIVMGKVEKRWVKTTDGKDMLVWVIYPPNFSPRQKYPALLYCQGGPQSAVSQFWSYRWNFQIMAAHDYIIVAPNRRGLPTFGQEWNNQIAGDYGGLNMLDDLSAIDAVASEPYVDSKRLGAVGASYGAYSVLWLAGHHNNRFKAFISHCGMFNLESQYGATDEYFFVNHDLGGAYWEQPKPKSYEFSPHLAAGNWNTPIMLITGQNDFRIPFTESFQAFNAAQLQGVPSRLLFFPDESHFVLKPQNAVLWQREFFKWLDTYLK